MPASPLYHASPPPHRRCNDQAIELLGAPDPNTMNGKPDLALLAVLTAYSLRRHEAVELNISHLQKREDHCGGLST